MKLVLVRHLWGVTEPWETAFPRFKSLGYGGIECGVPPPAERKRFRALLGEQGLSWVCQQWTGGKSVEEHLDSFKKQAEAGLECSPRIINSHSGRDGWDEADSCRFFEKALDFGKAAGVEIIHETHRGRILFNPWVTKRMLDRFPGLRLASDYSHWVCVNESLLWDDEAILRQCARRAAHIHARVGYPEGPQVPDPRAPEFKEAVERHELWWDWIWDAQERAGAEESTLCPEFGPAGYLHTLPYTNVPVADQAEICEWQARRQKERFLKRKTRLGEP